jgi:uncharacterized protein (TIGR02996 family)
VKSRKMFTAAFEALEASRDPRVVAFARDLAERSLEIADSSTGGWMGDKLRALADRMAALPAPQLPDEVEAACDALEGKLDDSVGARHREAARRVASRASLAGLFAAVYDAPDDDAPRLVLADALQEIGDERGELIVLQVAAAHRELSADERAREKQLLGSGKLAAWAHPLSGAGTCTFARGFPAKMGHVYERTARRLLGDPSWATLTTIERIDITPKLAAAVLAQPRLVGLRRVCRVQAATVNLLAETSARFAWTHLSVIDGEKLAEDALAIAPAVETLELTWLSPRWQDDDALARIARLARLQRCTVDVHEQSWRPPHLKATFVREGGRLVRAAS